VWFRSLIEVDALAEPQFDAIAAKGLPGDAGLPLELLEVRQR
jgi:hypothetical protein